MRQRRACPHCQGTGWAKQIDSAAMLEDIKAAVREKGIVVLTGKYVWEADAAALIGLAPKTLANWRGGDGRLPYEKRNQRPVYALTALADYLASA